MNEREQFEKELEKEKVNYGFIGKPKAWQEGFDRGFKEGWQAKASQPEQEPVA